MNKIKWFLWIAIAFLAYTGFVTITLNNNRDYPIDVIAVNDIAQSLAEVALTEGWEGLAQVELPELSQSELSELPQTELSELPQTESPGLPQSELSELPQTELPGLEHGLDYVVLDQEDHYITATRQGLNTDINSAIRNRDTIVDITDGETLLGRLILYNDTADIWNRHRVYLLVVAETMFLFVAALCLLYTIYMKRTILTPFRKLKSFASHVAAGNLDIPLTMDRGNQFGAFTESFDLMRDELSKARDNERKANQSKKELVASLSHDIKTPVASIMAVAELMAAKSEDDHDKRQLEIIGSKAEQINTLIMNMFSATLEELEELKVTVTEQSSHLIYELLKVTDYHNRTSCSQTSECLVLMDEQRLAQVIDNIISNSYKYANTAIMVSDNIIGDFLQITFQDYGDGVPEEEKALLCNKFYRASNSEGKSGSGLGLYISKYLMNKMSGDLVCENRSDGFAVILKLKIA